MQYGLRKSLEDIAYELKGIKNILGSMWHSRYSNGETDALNPEAFADEYISTEECGKRLGVSDQTIKQYSVVSAEVVEEMAISAMKKANSDYAIAVSGNAGPSSDNTSTAVGVVYIAVASAKGVQIEEFNFGHPREKVINRTVNKSLQMLQQEILKK